ncbi:ATP-grasp domain-containing protein [Butyrivibrio sp. WCE2006]|uniref:ATP-grasp domain-containing protein n=1 Tax=Butyrivibrio sp. WCE2006 TaxID=1410611 RepID=UPI0005D172F6|nr:ATP-grasp domain-containing protein [Butyrivibrio sp. WCE2006]
MLTIMIIAPYPIEEYFSAIDEAYNLGYRVVFCSDRLYSHEEVKADAIYEITWQDTEKIKEIAGREKVDGILCYMTDCSYYAAIAAKELGLKCNDPEGLAILNNKGLFRMLLKKAGCYCPKYYRAENNKDLPEHCADMKLPVIVKPEVNSSSRGMTVINSKEDDLNRAFEIAAESSRNGKVCIEEFVTAKNPLRGMEADIFVYGDEILWEGIRDSYRVKDAPIRPVYDLYPTDLSEEEILEVKNAVSVVVKEAGIIMGEHDVEGFFTSEGKFFILEINPRPSGYMNPLDIKMHCGINLIKLLVSTTVGDDSYWNELKHFQRSNRILISYSVFSKKAGILDHVHIDDSLHMIDYRPFIGQKEGSKVDDILSAYRPIAQIVLEFESIKERDIAIEKIESLVYPVLIE